MRLLTNLTGVTGVSNEKIQKSISHLLIIKTGTTAAITNETISASLQAGSNQHNIATKTKLRDLAVISQFENGYIHQAVGADSKIETAIMIELTGASQGVRLQNNDLITFDLSNLQTTATYNIYGIENREVGNVFLNYTAQNLNGTNSQTKTFSLSRSHKSLCISNNDSLEKIRLFSHAGEEVSYLPEELKAISREINGVTQMADVTIEGDAYNQTISGGAAEFFYIPTADFKGFEITTVGGVELTFVLTELRAF